MAGTLGDADAEATLRQDESQAEPGDAGAGGPNDARLRRDVPPHY